MISQPAVVLAAATAGFLTSRRPSSPGPAEPLHPLSQHPSQPIANRGALGEG